jgi:hypothetical protein
MKVDGRYPFRGRSLDDHSYGEIMLCMTLIYLSSFATISNLGVAWLLANWFYIVLFIAYLLLHYAYGRRSQIDTWCNSRPRIAGLMKLVRALFPDWWTFVQGLALVLLGRLPQSYVKIADTVVKTIDEKPANQ